MHSEKLYFSVPTVRATLLFVLVVPAARMACSFGELLSFFVRAWRRLCSSLCIRSGVGGCRLLVVGVFFLSRWAVRCVHRSLFLWTLYVCFVSYQCFVCRCVSQDRGIPSDPLFRCARCIFGPSCVCMYLFSFVLVQSPRGNTCFR